MSIALELAARGRGAVEPNPMVGAVLVREGTELSRGWHKRFGWPHAEVEALAALQEAGGAAAGGAAASPEQDAHGATLYVSLEPCCHYGKTPPCTRAIIEAGIARVVAAMPDPDERVAGKGFDELRRAGLEVTVGVLEQQARELLASYIKLRTARRPWVICKWAQTADGFLALPTEDESSGSGVRTAGKMPAIREGETPSPRMGETPMPRRWISSEGSRLDAHRIRGLCDGVCVGIGTALADDPMLTNRSGGGRQPARVVLDSHLRLPPGSWLAQTARTNPLLVATTREGLAAEPDRAAALRQAGAEVLALPDAAGGVNLEALLDELGKRQWTYLLVEGGAKVLRSFLYGGLADELAVYVAPIRAETRDSPQFLPQKPGAVPGFPGGPHLDITQVQAELPLRATGERKIGLDVLRQFRLKY